jgi:hypothetical protein
VITSKPASIHAITASPWAPLLAITGQHQVLLHHTDSLELAGILPFPEGEPASLAFTPDGRYLIVGGGVPGKSGLTITFHICSGEQALKSGKEFDSILATDIRPSFDIIATGGPSRLLKIWDTQTGELVRSIKKHTDWITALDLSADGVLLASGDRNGGVWVWESDTGSEFQTLRGHQAAITAATFRADSNLLATASEDGSVRFWEMNGGSEIKKIDAHPGGVTAFAFAPNGASITAGRDMKAKFWKPDFSFARDLAQNLPALPTAAALDFEGKLAFIADAHGIVRVFQTAEGKSVGEIHANPPSIETRLQKLTSEISQGQQFHESIEKILPGKIAAREAASRNLADAEKTLRQAAELHQVAKASGEQSNNEESVKIMAQELDRLQSAEKAILPLKQAMEAAEKTVADTRTACEQAKTSVLTLQAAAKKWSAAAINSRALIARREAEESVNAMEESQLDFTKSVADIGTQTAALNEKRIACEQLTNFLITKSLSPEVELELRATLTAVEIKVALEHESLRQSEDEILNKRNAIEEKAPVAQKSAAGASSLREAYLNALK